jgi:hypothetical protein
MLNKHIRDIRVLVIGADTIGQQAIKCLATMGVEKFIITDPTPVTNRYSNRLINFRDCKKQDTLAKYSIALAKQINPNVFIKELGKVNITTLTNLFQMEQYRPDIILYTCEYIISITDLEKLCDQFNSKYIVGLNNSLFGYLYSYPGKELVLKENLKKHSLIGYSILDSQEIVCRLSSPINTDQSNVLFRDRFTEIIVDIVSIKIDINSIVIKYTPEIIAFLNLNKNLYLETYTNRTVQFRHFSNHVDYSVFSLGHNNNQNNGLFENYTDYIKKPSVANKYFETFAMDSRFYPLSKMIGSLVANQVLQQTTPLEKGLLFNFNELVGKNIAKSSRGHVLDYDLHINIDRELLHIIKNKYITIVDTDIVANETIDTLAMMGFCQGRSSKMTVVNYSDIPLLLDKCQIKEIRGIPLDNEKIFSYNYWQGQDLLICSSSESQYKNYLDKIAIRYNKPYIETRSSNIQSYIPNQTYTYIDTIDNSDKPIIDSIDNTIEHAIQWFKILFNEIIIEYNFLTDGLDAYKNYIQKYSLDTQKIHIELLIILLELLFDPSRESAMEYIEKLYNYIYLYTQANIHIDFATLVDEYPEHIKSIYEYLDRHIVRLPKCDLSINIKSNIDKNYDLSTTVEEIDSLLSLLDTLELNNIEKLSPCTIDRNMVFTISSIFSIVFGIEKINITDIDKQLGNYSYIESQVYSSLVTVEAMLYFSNKKPHKYHIDIAKNIYRVIEMPKPIDIYNGIYSKELKTNVSTIPECFDRWKQIHINCVQDSCYTLTSLLNILDSDYSIVAKEIAIKNKIIYSDTETGYIEQNLEHILFKLGIRKSKYIEVGVVPVEKEGRPTVTPPIYISLN